MPPLRSLLQQSHMARGAFAVLLTRVGGVVLGYAAQVALARWAGSEAYGVYSLAFAWTSILVVIAALGMPQALVRLIPMYTVESDRSRLRGVLRFSERLTGQGAVAAAVLVTAGVFLYAGGWPGLHSTPGTIALACWIAAPALLLSQLHTQVCRTQGLIGAAYGLSRIVRPALVIAGAAVVVFALDASLTGAAIIFIVALAIGGTGVVQRWIGQRSLPPDVFEAPPVEDRRAWFSLSIPLFFASGFATLLLQTDLLLVGVFADVDSVGHYRVALQTASVVSFILGAVNTVAAPRFAALHAEGDRDRLQSLTRALIPWIAGPSLLGYGGLLVVAPFILPLFGPSFEAALVPLAVLATGHLFSALCGPVDSLLHMTGHQSAAAWVYGSVVVLNIGLSAAGLWWFGVLGAAVASAVCMGLWNVGLLILVRRRLGVDPSVWTWLR